jgi:hypothetical protein
LERSFLWWEQGPSKTEIAVKIQEWQHQTAAMVNRGRELEGLLELMAGATAPISTLDLTKDMEELATELGAIYTKRVVVRRHVQDPTATMAGVGTAARKRRERTTCPECYHKLPFPGHADNCSLKPKARTKKPVEKGKFSHSGNVDPSGTGAGQGQVPDPNATIEVDEEIDIPAVTFCHIEPKDWDQAWEAASWHPLEMGPKGEPGVLRVAWGIDPIDPMRYPTLIQAHTKLCERYGVAADNQPARIEVEKALWSAMYRLLKGKFGHLFGQLDAGTFPRDSIIKDIRETEDHPVLVYGVTMALYGIQDLERFASPILSQTLGPAIANA